MRVSTRVRCSIVLSVLATLQVSHVQAQAACSARQQAVCAPGWSCAVRTASDVVRDEPPFSCVQDLRCNTSDMPKYRGGACHCPSIEPDDDQGHFVRTRVGGSVEQTKLDLANTTKCICVCNETYNENVESDLFCTPGGWATHANNTDPNATGTEAINCPVPQPPTTTPPTVDRCKDSMHSGYQSIYSGQLISCSRLHMYCNHSAHGATLKNNCPKTCGICTPSAGHPTVDPCLSNPCANGGVCHAHTVNGHRGYTCGCAAVTNGLVYSRFAGDQCKVDHSYTVHSSSGCSFSSYHNWRDYSIFHSYPSTRLSCTKLCYDLRWATCTGVQIPVNKRYCVLWLNGHCNGPQANGWHRTSMYTTFIGGAKSASHGGRVSNHIVCPYTMDGTCDEVQNGAGTGACPTGTDSYDCRNRWGSSGSFATALYTMCVMFLIMCMPILCTVMCPDHRNRCCEFLLIRCVMCVYRRSQGDVLAAMGTPAPSVRTAVDPEAAVSSFKTFSYQKAVPGPASEPSCSAEPEPASPAAAAPKIVLTFAGDLTTLSPADKTVFKLQARAAIVASSSHGITDADIADVTLSSGSIIVTATLAMSVPARVVDATAAHVSVNAVVIDISPDQVFISGGCSAAHGASLIVSAETCSADSWAVDAVACPEIIAIPAPMAEEEEEEDCPICWETFAHGDVVVELPCNGKHKYHKECITEWMNGGHMTCPTCRDDVSWAEAGHGSFVVIRRVRLGAEHTPGSECLGHLLAGTRIEALESRLVDGRARVRCEHGWVWAVSSASGMPYLERVEENDGRGEARRPQAPGEARQQRRNTWRGEFFGIMFVIMIGALTHNWMFVLLGIWIMALVTSLRRRLMIHQRHFDDSLEPPEEAPPPAPLEADLEADDQDRALNPLPATITPMAMVRGGADEPPRLEDFAVDDVEDHAMPTTVSSANPMFSGVATPAARVVAARMT